MPIYEFRCRKCDYVFEKYQAGQGVDADPSCPKCQGTKVEKVFSLFASQGGGASEGSSGGCGKSSGGFS